MNGLDATLEATTTVDGVTINVLKMQDGSYAKVFELEDGTTAVITGSADDLSLDVARGGDNVPPGLATGSVVPGKPVTPAGEFGGVPSGRRTTIGPNEGPDQVRSLTRENESADILAEKGYRVEQNPSTDGRTMRDGSPNATDPDYIIEGEYFDSYAPGIGANGEPKTTRGVWSEVEKKVEREQAERIVLNLDDWDGDFDALKTQFDDWPIENLEEVIVIKDGEILNF